MTKDAARSQAEALFAKAAHACDHGASTSDFEPAFSELLDFLERVPASRQYAEKRFLAGLADGSVCWELTSFCMHSLRMQAVKNEVERLITNETDPRWMGPLSHILASFDDEWDDAEMYERYRPSTSSPGPGKTSSRRG